MRELINDYLKEYAKPFILEYMDSEDFDEFDFQKFYLQYIIKSLTVFKAQEVSVSELKNFFFLRELYILYMYEE